MTASTSPKTIHKIFNKLIDTLAVLLGFAIVGVGCIALFIFAWILLAIQSEPIARAMMPPVYVNSQFMHKDPHTGTWGYYEQYYYETTDSVQTVDAWYATKAPHLKRGQGTAGTIWFDNPDSDSFLAHLVGYLNSAEWDSTPSASVSIFVDPRKPTVTTIVIHVSWPSM